MSIEALKVISDAMESLGITYEFGELNSEIKYPYFTGEYSESDPLNEDGMQESTFVLTGHSRGSWMALEEAKEKIKEYFPMVEGKTVITDSGSAVAVFYSTSSVIPTVVAELKKIQINLTIKEWSVI